MSIKIYSNGSLNKKADDGLTFEQQMGTMTSARINEKLSILTPYAVGFELVKKDDDGTTGTGVMVYLMGDQVLFIPSFFSKSRLRTSDIIIVADKQQFLPATEGIVAYLKSENDKKVSDIVPKNTEGVSRGAPYAVTVRDVMTPLRKAAALKFTEDYAGVVSDYNADVLSLALSMGKDASMAMVNTLTTSPKIFNCFLEYYGADALHNFKTAAQNICMPEKKASTWYVDPFEDTSKNLSEDERKSLESFGFLIKTAEQNFSEVVNAGTLTEAFSTISSPGVYEVITTSGEPRTALVLIADDAEGCLHDCIGSDTRRGVNSVPYSFLHPSSRIPKADNIIYIMSDFPPNTYDNYNGVAVGRRYDLKDVDFRKELSSLGEPVESVPRLSCGCVIVCPDGDAVQLHEDMLMTNSDNTSWSAYYGSSGIRVDPVLDHLYISNNIMVIPKGCRVLHSINDWIDHEVKGIEDCAERAKKRAELSSKYRCGLATSADFRTIIDAYMSSKYNKVKIYSNGTNFSVTDDTDGSAPRSMSLKEASFTLVNDYKVDPMIAPALVRDTYPKDHVSNSTTRWYIRKQANGGDYSRGVSKYDIPNKSFTEATYYGPQLERISSGALIPTKGMTPEKMMGIIQHAAESGIKEVFDVSIVKTLLNTSRPDILLGDYYTTIMKMLDKLCRMLFLAYAKEDSFIDQFGEDKYDDFVETIRNSMNDLSELFLFLRTRSVLDTSMDIQGEVKLLDGNL